MRPIRDATGTELLREMSFIDHLAELRGVIVASVIAILALSIGFWVISGRVLDWIVRDVPVDHLTFLAPSEAFMVRTKMSFVLGAMTAFPYVGYRVWKFVSPGLFRRERSRIVPIVAASAALFYAGVVFAYFFVVPVIITFMLGYATERVQPMIAVGAYFDTVSRLCLGFGVVFQLPIVILLLAVTGLVPPQTFLRQWRYAVVIIFTAGAILTPPDPASQVLMAVPLCVLYIGSSFFAVLVMKRRHKRESEGE